MVRSAPRPRNGFTIIESMVALTLFAVGLLGMAGTAAAIQRLSTAADARSRVAAIGWSRLEELRGTACASRAPGTAITRGIEERWTAALVPGITIAADSMLLPIGPDGVARRFGLTAAFPC